MKRKITAYRIIPAFLLAIIVVLLPVTVWAEETTLTTVVPSCHTLHINLTGEGAIIVDGVAYMKSADIQIQRQSKPEISLQVAEGYKIETVLWDGENVTEAVTNGTWIAPAVTEDVILSVTFEKISSNPQTGDCFQFELWFVLLILSVLGLAVCLLHSKKALV